MNSRRGAVQWLALCGLMYAALIGVVVWSMLSARASALARLSSAQSIGDWQKWRDDVEQQQSQPGPVARRVPKSNEPPGLVLMRDYFAVCLVGAIFFTTLLYWVLAWFISGMLRSSPSRTNS